MTLLLLAGAAFALSLDQAWDLALQNSPDAAVIQGQADAGATVHGLAMAAMAPRISATAGYTINQYETAFDISKLLPEELAAMVGDTEPFVINQKQFWSGSATVVQPVFSGAAIPGLRAANAVADAARMGAEANLDGLHVAVANAWWGAYTARVRTSLAEDGVARSQRHLDLALAREKVGAARPTSTLQARAALARAQREAADAAAARQEAEGNLARLVGVSADVSLDDPAPRNLPYSSADDAVNAAMGAPSVQVAELRAAAAKSTRTATDLGWVPNVNARFTESYSENSGFSGEKWNWQAAITADWNLFDGGARIAKEREAAANAMVASRAAERERLVVEADVRALWARLEAARRGRALAEEELHYAEQSLNVAEVAYANGAMTDLELADARAGRDGAALAVVASGMAEDLLALSLLARTGDL